MLFICIVALKYFFGGWNTMKKPLSFILVLSILMSFALYGCGSNNSASSSSITSTASIASTASSSTDKGEPEVTSDSVATLIPQLNLRGYPKKLLILLINQ